MKKRVILREEGTETLIQVSKEKFDKEFVEGWFVDEEEYSSLTEEEKEVETYFPFYTEYGSDEGAIQKEAGTGNFFHTAWNGSNHVTTQFEVVEVVESLTRTTVGEGIEHDDYYVLADGRILRDSISGYASDPYGECEFVDAVPDEEE